MADVLTGKTGVKALLLPAYLREAGRRPFRWGELDCFLFVADWVERATGIDPAGEYRGAYTNMREGRNIIRDNGGPMRFAGELIGRSGCRETGRPVRGDVGLVRAAFARRRRGRVILVPVGAICLRENMWAIKSAGVPALAFGAFPVLQAWTFARG